MVVKLGILNLVMISIVINAISCVHLVQITPLIVGLAKGICLIEIKPLIVLVKTGIMKITEIVINVK